MANKRIVLLILILVLIIVIIAITASYAIWFENLEEAKRLKFEIEDENPSVKYQIYIPIDNDGHRVAGELDIINREYTLEQEEDISLIVGYALVGWHGGINVARLEIPTEYSMKINGTDITKPPTHIFARGGEFQQYLFTQNNIIEEIEIPQNIIHIDNGVFVMMASLRQVVFTGSGDITIGKNAFEPNSKNIDIYYDGREVEYFE